MSNDSLPATVLSRRAVVYVRQSTTTQVEENHESRRRQYDLVALARTYGFADVVTIDDDLGRSASGTVSRPGFESLVAQICQGIVGAVFCLEASRLARNGRDWHHLLELCGLVHARVVDAEGVYDPSRPNDRLLLGLKGTMSEFELNVLRQRLLEAALAKARRGELRLPVPIGYLWSQELGLRMDPDRRIQEAIPSVIRLFGQLGSARQVLRRMRVDGLLFPRPLDPKRASVITWCAPVYRNIISVLTNPFYAGAYAYGKSAPRTRIVDGRLQKTYGHIRPSSEWTVLLREHHEGYMEWGDYERCQTRLAGNAFGKRAGGTKAARGGRALLAGLLRCARCGRVLQVAYGGHRARVARYRCKVSECALARPACITLGALRPDRMVAMECLRVVQPLAVEAAMAAEEQALERQAEIDRALALQRSQAEYEVKLARRRYESVDPDNRLVAAELEARWNAAMERLRECDQRAAEAETSTPVSVDRRELLTLAGDLQTAWDSPATTTRSKQRLLRSLVREIIVDVDEAERDVVMVIHWHGGQHSELRVRKPKSGEHTNRASAEADALIREMATKWSDEHVAATLNRMGMKTGQGQSWSARRVANYRRKHDVPGYESAIKDGRCLTMREAAQKLGVSAHVVRKLIVEGTLPARQIMMDAPWQIMITDLESPTVTDAIKRLGSQQRPCREHIDQLALRIPSTCRSDAQ